MPEKTQNLREACCDANRRLHELGVVDLTFGNVSVVDRERGYLAIKPSGVAYQALSADQIPVLRLDARPDAEGNLDLNAARVFGELRPSSDTPTHLYLCQSFPSIGAVVHTHSRNATAFAQAGRAIPCTGTTHADYFHGPVPVARPLTEAEVSNHYEWETGKVIAECFQDLDPESVPGVLLNGHAPFVWGPTADQALESAYALEIIAEMSLKALALGPENTLPRHVLDKHFFRKHGQGAYYGQG